MERGTRDDGGCRVYGVFVCCVQTCKVARLFPHRVHRCAHGVQTCKVAHLLDPARGCNNSESQDRDRQGGQEREGRVWRGKERERERRMLG